MMAAMQGMDADMMIASRCYEWNGCRYDGSLQSSKGMDAYVAQQCQQLGGMDADMMAAMPLLI